MKDIRQQPQQHFHPERQKLLVVVVAGLLVGGVVIAGLMRSTENSFICNLSKPKQTAADSSYIATPIQLHAIVHYATSKVTPQQSLQEITLSFDVLKQISPCNFLVFGLGFDSLMWTSLNPRGKTLFLEEDPKWVQTVLKSAPTLNVHTVKYRTQLKQADELLAGYKAEPLCSPENAFLKGNRECRLALDNLPEEVYEREWDVIMIDAPRGWFPEAPGRMAAIFSAAVMARQRKGSGVTHVYLHDVDRKVEKMFAEEFLCKKYLKKGVGRLWHFEIPSAVGDNRTVTGSDGFC